MEKRFFERRFLGGLVRYHVAPGTRVITESRMAKGWPSEPLAESPVPELGPFELPGYGAIPAQVVRVEVTGRTIQRFWEAGWVRVRVVFPTGEGGEVAAPGWAMVRTMREEVLS